MHFIQKHLPNFLKLLVLIIVGAIAVYFILPYVTSPEVFKFIDSLGVFAPFALGGYFILSHFFAPIAGTPGLFVAVAVYGLNEAMIVLYIASMISANINFFLSRKYGRPLLRRFLGEKAIKEIDLFTKVEGVGALVYSRVFGFAFYDVISYAAGLTKVKYKTYMWITAVFTLIPNLAFQFIFRDVDLASREGAYIWIGSIFFASGMFLLLFKQYWSKRKDLTIDGPVDKTN